VSSGAVVTLRVSATGATQYQWQFDGNNLPGETNTDLTLTSVNPSMTGTYTVVVSNGDGSVTSVAATLTVSPLDFSITSPGSVKPGRRGKAVLTITNPTHKHVAQMTTIRLLASTDQLASGQVSTLLIKTKHIRIGAGKTISLALPFRAPAISAGAYSLLAVIDGISVPVVAPTALTVLAKHHK
jgi:hypothetical protein